MSLVTPDTGLLFWMVIIFGVVFCILAKFGFPVITDMIRKRTESISQSLKMAEEARNELAELNKEQTELLLQAKKEQSRILEDAEKIKASIIAQARTKAQEEANKVMAQARTEIAAEKESALNDIRKEVAMLSMNITEKLLRSEFSSESVRNDYIDRVMKEFTDKKYSNNNN